MSEVQTVSMHNVRGRAAGFTLLEILLALVLLGIIAGLVGTAFHASLRTVERTDRRMAGNERMRTAVQIIDSQIQSAVLMVTDDSGLRTLYFNGDQGSLRFASTYSVFRGASAFIRVRYDVQRQADNTFALIVTERLQGAEEEQHVRLVEACSSISLAYRGSQESGMVDWADAWEEEKAEAPREVEIRADCPIGAFSLVIQPPPGSRKS